jgi:hypothetical protein
MRTAALAALLVSASIACASAQQRTVIGHPDGSTTTVETNERGEHTITDSNGVTVPNSQIGSGATHRGLIEIYKRSGSLIVEATRAPTQTGSALQHGSPRQPQPPRQTKPALARHETKPVAPRKAQAIRETTTKPHKAEPRGAIVARRQSPVVKAPPHLAAREVPYRRQYWYSAGLTRW